MKRCSSCGKSHLLTNFHRDAKSRGPGPGYHIDHIVPLAAFDLTDENQVRLAFAPENHQWLLAKENLETGARPWGKR
jgi:hypothetical protein